MLVLELRSDTPKHSTRRIRTGQLAQFWPVHVPLSARHDRPDAQSVEYAAQGRDGPVAGARLQENDDPVHIGRVQR